MSHENMWNYLINIHLKEGEDNVKINRIFKSKNPKKYIQVKTSVINNGT
jgi:hypothetical protein